MERGDGLEEVTTAIVALLQSPDLAAQFILGFPSAADVFARFVRVVASQARGLSVALEEEDEEEDIST